MRDAFATLRVWLELSFRAAPVLGTLRTLAAVAQAVLAPLGTVGTGLLVDGLLTGNRDQVDRGLLLAGLSIAVAIVFTAVFWIAGSTLDDLSQRYVQTRIMRAVAGIPSVRHHEDPEASDAISLVRNDARWLGGGSYRASFMVEVVVQAVAIGGILVSIAPWLLVLIPAAWFPAWAARRTNRRRFAAEREGEWSRRRADALLALARDPDRGVEIRCSGSGAAVVDSLVEAMAERQAKVDEAGRYGLRLGVLSNLAFVAVLSAALFGALTQTLSGDHSVGSFVVLVLLIPQLEAMAGGFQALSQWTVEIAQRVGRYRWLESYAKEHAWSEGTAPAPGTIEHGIRLDDVTFTYPQASAPALRGMSLDLPAGTTVALVGENGAGKSTLVKLLARLYDPDSGVVSVDGRSLTDFDPSSWRSRLSAAFQDHADLELVVRESVGVGDLDAGDDAVWSSVDQAAARGVVESLPEGLSAQLGRQFAGGAELSGGQWQRLAIARGLIRPEPLLMLLDEPTSALDPEAEDAILSAYVRRAREVSRRTGGVTVIVSHRMSTVRSADLVAFLRDGRVAEFGTHTELMAAGGGYAELFELQASGYR